MYGLNPSVRKSMSGSICLEIGLSGTVICREICHEDQPHVNVNSYLTLLTFCLISAHESADLGGANGTWDSAILNY